MASVAAIVVVAVLVAQALRNDPRPRRTPTRTTITILEDDFADSDYGWAINSDDIASIGYVHDRYRILIKEPEYHTHSFVSGFGSRQAVSVEADVIMTGRLAEPGVLCVADEASPELYVFAFHGSPGKQAPHIIRYQEESATVLAMGEPSDVISTRGANRIRGDCIGGGPGQPTQLVLYVNGTELLRYEDPDGFEGFIGMGLWVYASKGGTEVLFDDAVMKTL